jgi:hypothetical protein
LAKVIIAPYLHRVHHSTERNEHDNNYGTVFSIWDRLFGSLTEREPAEIGIKNSSPQTLLGLVKFGFTPANPVPVHELDLSLTSMIAEAAYYKAEKRAFTPGNESDWLEAKGNNQMVWRSVHRSNESGCTQYSDLYAPVINTLTRAEIM